MRLFGYTVVLAALLGITYMALAVRSGDVSAIEPAAGGDATYTGTLTYMDRMALLPNAQIEVQIIDDEGNPVADSRRGLNGAQVPVPFSITVNTEVFAGGGNYYLVGALTQGDDMARVTDKVNLAFTQPGNHVLGELMTRRVNLNMQPDAEDGAQEDAVAPSMDHPSQGTTWKLSDLNGIAILPNSRATLVLGPDGRLHGNGGCNNIGSAYTISGDTLTVDSSMISTMMACPDGIDAQERDYTQQLVGTHTMLVDGDTMMLQTGDGRTLKFIRTQ